MMSTSQRTIDQVKSILGKLDRNIDAARARRMQDRPGTPPVSATTIPATPAPGPTLAPATMQSQPNTTIPATTPPSANRSQYGRATPMRLTRPTPLNNTGT